MIWCPCWQEIKNKTKNFIRTWLLLWRGCCRVFVRKQSTLCLFNDSHIKWFILKSSVRYLYLYINPHVTVNRDIPCALEWEVSEKSSCKEQSSWSICWGSGRWKRESPNSRSHVPFLDVTLTYLREASKRIIFLMCFKNENTLFSYVYFLRTEGFF